MVSALPPLGVLGHRPLEDSHLSINILHSEAMEGALAGEVGVVASVGVLDDGLHATEDFVLTRGLLLMSIVAVHCPPAGGLADCL